MVKPSLEKALTLLHGGLFASHRYFMLANGALSLFVMLRHARFAFNFKAPVIPPGIIVALNCAILPLFYLLESLPLLGNCSDADLPYCKFAIHHLFTVVLFLVIYQFQLYSGPAMAIQATHGIMNFLANYHQLSTYVWCQWYIATTILCSVHVGYHCINTKLPGVPKGILWLELFVLVIVGVNNLFSSELLSTCVRPEDSYTMAGSAYVWALHCAFTGLYCFAVWKYTKEECQLGSRKDK